MKKYLATLIIGLLIGSGIIFALYNWGERPVVKTESEIILDDIIAEWTSPSGPDQKRQAYFLQLKEARLGFLPDTVRALATHIESIYKIPKGIVCAQFILESKWGLCSMGAENYFGMTLAAVKKYMLYPAYVIRRDTRYQNGIAIQEMVRFARFKNIQESFEVYGKYLQGSPLYRDAFKQVNSPENFARQLAKYYASDPGYALKLIILMRKYKLN